MVIMRLYFKSLNDKIVNSASSPSKCQEQKCEIQFGDPVAFLLRGF